MLTFEGANLQAGNYCQMAEVVLWSVGTKAICSGDAVCAKFAGVLTRVPLRSLFKHSSSFVALRLLVVLVMVVLLRKYKAHCWVVGHHHHQRDLSKFSDTIPCDQPTFSA